MNTFLIEDYLSASNRDQALLVYDLNKIYLRSTIVVILFLDLVVRRCAVTWKLPSPFLF